MERMRTMALVLAIAVAVTAMPQASVPDDATDLDAVQTVDLDVVSLLQEAKTARTLGGDKDILDLGAGRAAKHEVDEVGELADLPEAFPAKMGKVATEDLGESAAVSQAPAGDDQTADKIDFEISFGVIAKNDVMLALSTTTSPQKNTMNNVYEILIQSGSDKKCCIRDQMNDNSFIGCNRIPAAAELKWNKDSSHSDSKDPNKMWSERRSRIQNFKLVKKGSTMTLYHMINQGPAKIVERTFPSIFAAKYVSVASTGGSTGVWTVCGKECVRKVYTPNGGSDYQYQQVTEISNIIPSPDHWTAEFWPEINQQYGVLAAGIGSTFNKNKVIEDVRKKVIQSRSAWTKFNTHAISFTPTSTETWKGLEKYKYELGEQAGATTENPLYTTNFAARFRGLINIPEAETYYLYTWVDDAAEIQVGHNPYSMSIKHTADGTKETMKWEMSEVQFGAGDQIFEVNYMQYTGTAGLWVMWGTKTNVGANGKCGTDSPSSLTCSKAFIQLPAVAGGAVKPNDMTVCGQEGGSMTVRAWKNLNLATGATGVADAMALTEKAPDKYFTASSIYFENTASFFSGLDSAFTNKFAMQVDGYFKAKTQGEYKFWLVSDDGSEMWLDNRWFLNENIPILVQNDGKHAIQGIAPWAEKVKAITLSPGYYRLSVYMFDTTTPSAASDLEVYVETPDDFGPRLMNCNDMTHSRFQAGATYAYVGCYQDEACTGGEHDLPIKKGQTGNTVEGCSQLCTGYRYFSVQGARECFCGNKYGSGNPPKGALEYKPLPTPTPEAFHYKPKGCACDAPDVGTCKMCVYERLSAGETDLAFGQKASASNAPKPEEPWRAVDGFTNHGAFMNQVNAPAKSRSMACTAVREVAGQDSWWRVDMGGNQRVESFAVTGISDGAEDGSKDWEARVGDWKDDGKQDGVCLTGVNAYKGTHWYQCDKPMSGRYFSLWKNQANMVICEVQVFGDQQDLAFGKPAEQSSIRKLESGAAASGGPKKAVDGNTDGMYSHQSCTQTDPKSPHPPWWRVDLEGTAAIDTVTIWNRSDCCGDRLYAEGHEFEVRVGDNKEAYDKNNKCGDKHTLDPPALSKTIQCDKQIGQYVFIDIPQPMRVLTLCEVRVVGAHVVEDVAEGKPCGQSSAENCARALDGTTDGNMASGSCTITNEQDPAWWYVDLQDEYKVTAVEIWGRTDCCGDRLSGFQVRVGDNKPTSNDYTKNRACNEHTNEGKVDFGEFNRNDAQKPAVVVNCNREPGSYVSINIPDREDYLTLCEVKVYGQVSTKDRANLALNRPASQIDTGYGGVASRAVDGNTAGSFGEESCTHTNKKDDPWWKVDLQKTAEVHRVIVWNRSDCCGTRLEDFEVRVGEMEDIYQNPVCGGTNKVDTETHQPKIVNCEKKQGRYVSVDLKGKNEWLTLCEVKVNGEWSEEGMQLGKPTLQSSTMNSGYAKRAVDGNTDPNFAGNSCTQTNTETNPWWMVDLEKTASISKVQLFNRADCCGDKIRNLEVRVGAVEPKGTEFSGNPACGSTHWSDAPEKGGSSFTVDCDEAIGRYVVVDLPGDNKQLTLCEVRIRGAFTTPAFSKCKASVEGIEADLEKARADEKAAKDDAAKLKTDHSDVVEQLNKDLLAARDDEAATKSDAHQAAGIHTKAATVLKTEHDKAIAAHEDKIEQFKNDAAQAADRESKLAQQKQAVENELSAHKSKCDQDMRDKAAEITALQSLHTSAAKKCLEDAQKAKERTDQLQKQADTKLDDEVQAHQDSIIAHDNAMTDKNKECEDKEEQAREEGRKAGLQACPGVNGLMREIWRLRQKLGAADAAANNEEEEQ